MMFRRMRYIHRADIGGRESKDEEGAKDEEEKEDAEERAVPVEEARERQS